jgi:hypothetical protein
MMKKTFLLLTILFLLFAGLGFAQDDEGGWNVFGVFRTGLNVQFTDRIDDGPFIYAGSNEKNDLAYLLMKLNWTNPVNTFGFETGAIFKGKGIPVDSSGNYSIDWDLKIDNTFGWLKMFDRRLTLYGGGGEWEFNDPFKTPGPVDSNLGMDGFGMVLIGEPLLDMGFGDLKIGASVWTKEGHSTLINESKIIFHAAYRNDFFDVVANFAYRQYGPKFYADEESISFNAQMAKDHRANFGINIHGLSNFGLRKIAFDAEIRDIGGGRDSIRDPIMQWGQTGVTVYPLYLGQAITWQDQNEFFTLRTAFKQVFRINDDFSSVNFNGVHLEYAPSFSFMIDTEFKINEFIVPKLGAVYIMNSDVFGSIARDLRFNEGLNSEDCLKDFSGLQVRGAVEFRIGGNPGSVLELGYTVNKNLSKDIVATARNSTLDHGLYASMTLKF